MWLTHRCIESSVVGQPLPLMDQNDGEAGIGCELCITFREALTQPLIIDFKAVGC